MSLYERAIRGIFNALLWFIFLTGTALTIYMAIGRDLVGTMMLFGATLFVTSIGYFFVQFVLFISFGSQAPPPAVVCPEMHVHVHCPESGKVQGNDASFMVGGDPLRPARSESHFDEYIDADFRELGGKHEALTVSRLDRILDDRRRR